MNPEIDLVIFDLAGTTVRDRGEVPAAFSAALGAHGIELSAAQINNLRGASKRQAILGLVPEGPQHVQRAAEIDAAFRSHLAERYQRDGVEAIDGAERTFGWLREQGIRVAFNTGFDREITALLLAALGWNNGTADAVVCGDDVAQGRPAPDLIFKAMAAAGVTRVDRVAAVGDTALDLEAGHRAGVRWNIGVLTGAHDRARLERAPHTHLIDSIADLPRVLPGGGGRL